MQRRTSTAAGFVALAAIVGANVMGERFAEPMEDASAAAERYVETVAAGDYAAAHAQECARLRSTQTPEQLAARAGDERATIGEVTKVEVTDAAVSGNVAAVGYRIETTLQGRIDGDARLLQEDGTWRWCGAKRAELRPAE